MTVQPDAQRRTEPGRQRVSRWLGRVGVALAMLSGVTGFVASPAYAQGDVSIAASNDVDLTVGGNAKRVTFTISNNGTPTKARVEIDVPLGDQGVRIVQGPDGCEVRNNNTSLRCEIGNLGANSSEQLSIQIGPPGEGGPPPGESRSGQGQARLQADEDITRDNNTAGFGVTLHGEDKPQGVAVVRGIVKDSKEQKPVKNAKVTVKDGEGTTHSTATNNKGRYRLESTADNPIAPGSLEITVTKSGFEKKTFRKSAEDGEEVKVDMLMVATASPSPSATPTSTDTGAATPGDTAAAAEDSESSPWAWLLYTLAALLVLGGIAAIVWLFRRKDDEEGEDEYGDGPDRTRPPAGARGGYPEDPYGAPTTRMGGAQPTAMMGYDAPTTAMGRPGYDAPTTAMGSPGYDQPTTAMGRPGYDQPTSMINRPGHDQPTGAMGAPGYDQPTTAMGRPGLDEPTGRYGAGEPTGRYGAGEPTGRHGASAGDDVYPAGRDHYASGYRSDYGQSGHGRDPYSGPGQPDPGYGRDPGYGGREPGYGAHSSGYGDRADYGDRTGYGDQGGRHSGGRHSGGDGYDEGGQRPSPRRRPDTEDRRLDWYED